MLPRRGASRERLSRRFAQVVFKKNRSRFRLLERERFLEITENSRSAFYEN